MKRRTFIQGLGASISLGPAALSSAAPPGAANSNLTRINPQFMITAKDAQAWHVAKDSQGGPTMAGSASWKNFVELVEKELRTRGVVDIFHNKWNYERWFTSEYPDDSKWSLHIDGQKIRIPSYGAYSGMTPEEGISRELVVYKPGIAAETLRGKIVVIPPGATPPPDGPPDPFTAGGRDLTAGDYEYLSDATTFPNPLVPRAAAIKATPFGKMWVQAYIRHLQKAGAEGMLFTIPISYEAAAGTYSFVVPSPYALPTLFLDNDSAAQVVEAANAGKQATLRLVAQQENAETYQLFGFLPGKNYKTPSDEQLLLVTHTDGPSISQENGALGILGMVHYLSTIPQAERPRTIKIFLDCRHYMPGTERAFSEQDYATKHPDVFQSVVAAMGIEHLGQIEYLDEPGEPFHPSGLAELSTVWITQNQRLVDLAVKSIEDNGLRRVQVQCPGRPGIHGKEQGPWYGLGAIARRLGVPGAATMGSMTAYWSTKARISAFDADHFVTQVATMSQIAGELMIANISELQT